LADGLDIFYRCCVGACSVQSLSEAVKIATRQFLLSAQIPLKEQPELVEWLVAFVRVFYQIENLCLSLLGQFFFQLEVEVDFAIYSYQSQFRKFPSRALTLDAFHDSLKQVHVHLNDS
jgi:hypothetical protein